jgi:hypothetical protein
MIRRLQILLSALFLSCAVGCFAATILVTNDGDDMMATKRIWIRFVLASDEYALLKNSLQFSITSPECSLVSWNPVMQPMSIYIGAFRKKKQAFIGPLAGWIDFTCTPEGKRILCDAGASLAVSCLVVCRNGCIKPCSVCIMLARNSVTCKHNDSSASSLLHPRSCIKKSQHVKHSTLAIPPLEKDFELIDHLEHQWAVLRAPSTLSLTWRFLWWLDGLMIMLLLLFMLRAYYRWRHIPIYRWYMWNRQLLEACGFVTTYTLLLGGTLILQPFLMWSITAVVCSLGLLYVCRVPGRKETLWGRLKNLIGTTCGIFIMPCALKAVLLFYGLG